MRYLFVLLITSVLVFTGTFTALAQDPTPTPEPDQPPVNAQEMALSFADLGYGSITLKGAFGSSQIYVPIPAGWAAADDARVALDIQSSPLLIDISNLTVSVNNKPIASTTLGKNGDRQSFDFTIPADLITSPGLLIQFQGYLRLTDDVCEDSNIPGQWANILGSSTLTLYVGHLGDLPQLSDLTNLLFTRGVEGQPDPLLFVIPDNPDAATLNTAAQVAAGLGHLASDDSHAVTVQSASETTDEQLTAANVVLIGLPGDLPLIGALGAGLSTLHTDGLFYTDDGQPVPEADAVFQLVRSPWNADHTVLVVSANQLDGLTKAGVVFMDSPTVRQFSGDHTFASGPIPLSNDALPAPWSSTQTTLEQLGFGSRTVRGTGIINEYYTIYREPGTVFSQGTQFVLHGTASALLDNPASYVAVFLDEVPLGTYSIGALIQNQALVFSVPPQIDEKGPQQRLTLRIEISNQATQQQCEAVNRENAWVHLDSGSFFAVNAEHLPLPNLLAFPYPFAAQSPTAPVTVVLPDDFAPYYAAGAIRLSYVLGFASPSPTVDLYVETLGQFDAAQGTDHLIFLANSAERDLIDHVLTTPTDAASDATPPQPAAGIFDGPSGDMADLALYTALDEPYGLLYAATSPVQADRAVLVVMSDTRAGFEAALDGLLGTLPPVAVSGTVAVVAPDRAPYVIYAPADIAALTRTVETPSQTAVTNAPASGTGTESQADTAPQATTSGTTSRDDGVSKIDASVAIIIIPIAVSIFLLLAIWVFQRGRRDE